MGILERASITPLTAQEIEEATTLLDQNGICVANIQHKMRIGWNRAADLVEHVKGFEALPQVARDRYAAK